MGWLLLALAAALLPALPLCAYHPPLDHCCGEPAAPQPRLLACCDLHHQASPAAAAQIPPRPQLPLTDGAPLRLGGVVASPPPRATLLVSPQPRAPPPVI